MLAEGQGREGGKTRVRLQLIKAFGLMDEQAVWDEWFAKLEYSKSNLCKTLCKLCGCELPVAGSRGGNWRRVGKGLAKLSQSMTFQFEMCLMGFHGRRPFGQCQSSQCGIYQV